MTIETMVIKPTVPLDEVLNQLSDFKPSITATPLDQLKLAIIGPPGGGKSRLAATCRKPSFHYDFDGRAGSIAGIEGVYIKTLQDTNPIVPDAFSKYIRDIGQLEYIAKQGKELPVKTVVLDSITYMCAAAMAQSMSDTKGATTLTVSGQKFRIPRGFENYDGEYNLIVNSIIRLFYLGVDVIACFHERAEEAPDSTQENPRFTGKITVHPPRMNKLLPLFNEQWRVRPEGSVYKVQTKPDYEFIGKTCLSVDQVEEPNIEKMIEKHFKALGRK